MLEIYIWGHKESVLKIIFKEIARINREKREEMGRSGKKQGKKGRNGQKMGRNVAKQGETGRNRKKLGETGRKKGKKVGQKQ